MLVERHHHRGTAEIARLCDASREVYNHVNYRMRQAWFGGRSLPDISELVASAREHVPAYQAFGSVNTAVQTIRQCLIDWATFKRTLKAWRRDSSKFHRRPKPPDYKHKLAQVIFYNYTIKGGRSKKPRPPLITPTNNCFAIRSDKHYKRVIITPKRFGFVIEVHYEEEVKPKAKSGGGICSVDLGVNNLMAITSDRTTPILVNGRIVKSINQWYNKRPCKSRLRKRYWRLENYFHHASKWLIEYCLKHGIGTMIIGRNTGWKQDKGGRQGFQSIPHYLLIRKIQYKSAAVGLVVRFTEEAWTSRASFLDRDQLPNCKAEPPMFSGQRVHRGLYRSGNGTILSADVNGAANIVRKVIQDSEFLARLDRSLAARPVKTNPLKGHSPGASLGSGCSIALAN